MGGPGLLELDSQRIVREPIEAGKPEGDDRPAEKNIRSDGHGKALGLHWNSIRRPGAARANPAVSILCGTWETEAPQYEDEKSKGQIDDANELHLQGHSEEESTQNDVGPPLARRTKQEDAKDRCRGREGRNLLHGG